MNEKLTEIYRSCRPVEALKSQDIYESANVLLGLEVEKFAELIVRECVDTVQKRYMGDNNREDMEVLRCVEDLKQHFGVEE